MIPSMKQGSPDDFQTPVEALEPLLPYLHQDWLVWEPACGNGNLVRGFEAKGFKVIGSDILTGMDFLQEHPERYDCIITNPPFSLKNEFLETCYKQPKPFALLLPLTTFETPTRQKLFQEYGVEVIFFDKRINFEVPDHASLKKSGSWFSSAWFTWRLNLPKQLNFVKFNRGKDEVSSKR